MAPKHEHPGEQAAPDPVRLLGIRDEPLSLDEVFTAVDDPSLRSLGLMVETFDPDQVYQRLAAGAGRASPNE